MKKLTPLLLLLCACTVGPDYQQPEPGIPEAFRGAEPTERSFADLEWFEIFHDPALQEIIRTALRENFDVRIAAERVLEARARLMISKADRLPVVEGAGQQEFFRNTKNGTVPLPSGVDPEQELSSVGISATWELDFWGRIRRANEAARAELLATKMARGAVIQSLVTDLALAYFDLLEFDEELDITRRTLDSRDRSRELVALRLEQGVANKVELRQAEALVLVTARLIPALEQSIEQQENLIRLLMGGNPGAVPRGEWTLDRRRDLEIPLGLPSDLLHRRPDVQLAEQNLIAANARIGEAKALLFPTIRLAGSGGLVSEDLGDLFNHQSATWSVLPSVVMPIFNAGRLRANVEVTESQQRQAVLDYLRTLRQAFREAADAIVAHQKTREVRKVQEQLEATLADQTQLSHDRYRGGVTSYLEVLDSERDHFDAEFDLVRAIRDELFSTVLLYRALGGGWVWIDDDAIGADTTSESEDDT